MDFEQPKKLSSEEIEEMRKRVLAIGKDDAKGADSVYDLAKTEDSFRGGWKNDGLPNEGLDKYADKHSTQEMERLEALRKIEDVQQELTVAEQKSMVDPLTGLGNRGALEKISLAILKVERGRARTAEDKRDPGFEERRKPPIHSLIILDLDFFKKINDTHGHLVGDEVLIKTAKIIEKAIRKEGSVYRHGGEEFSIFLPHTNAEEAAKAAERIREAIEKNAIEISENQKINITASLGLSSTEQISTDVPKDKLLELMMKNSDRALYQSKEAGRNKVSIFVSETK